MYVVQFQICSNRGLFIKKGLHVTQEKCEVQGLYIGDVCFKYLHKSYKGMISDMTKTIKANHHVQTITSGLIYM